MKIQVRTGVFETNSSSVHTICLCSKSDYNSWVNGEMVYDSYDECLIPVDKKEKITYTHNNEIIEKDYDDRYYTYDEYDFDMRDYYAEKNINGEDIVAFGYYGYDG